MPCSTGPRKRGAKGGCEGAQATGSPAGVGCDDRLRRTIHTAAQHIPVDSDAGGPVSTGAIDQRTTAGRCPEDCSEGCSCSGSQQRGGYSSVPGWDTELQCAPSGHLLAPWWSCPVVLNDRTRKRAEHGVQAVFSPFVVKVLPQVSPCSTSAFACASGAPNLVRNSEKTGETCEAYRRSR